MPYSVVITTRGWEDEAIADTFARMMKGKLPDVAGITVSVAVEREPELVED